MQIPPADELIAAARASVSETADDHDLATALRQRYGLRTTQSSISRWRSSPRGPSYEATIALLDVAGWLKADRPWGEARDAAEASRDAARDVQARRSRSARESRATR